MNSTHPSDDKKKWKKEKNKLGANVALGHKIFPSKCISQGDCVRRTAGVGFAKYKCKENAELNKKYISFKL